MTPFDKNDDADFNNAFIRAFSILGPVERRVVQLALSRVAELETAGRGAEGDALLETLSRIVRAKASDGRRLERPGRSLS